ncbi:cation/H(+) antiporter 15-like [Quillaja saponaria]|uniref:Cation/H(+) antiporter 15-like n=1 Tax=Quillaja saponaria TaxID=32244 RepID=A0AAD7PI60_QUISA|nr:cation/H(+) antiporter 15-like [Quillaja saponaria]
MATTNNTSDPSSMEPSEEKDNIRVCFNKTTIPNHGIWQAENALANSVPIFVLQLVIVLTFHRICLIIFKLLRQPRIVAETVAGIIMGPCALGNIPFFSSTIFPFEGMVTLETVANLALIYNMFLIGLESDVKPVLRAGKKSYSIAISGIIIPAAMGFGLFQLLQSNSRSPAKTPTVMSRGSMFWAISLANSNFPDLAKTLINLKLLRSEIGQTALTSSLATDFASWVFLLIGLVIAHEGYTSELGYTFTFIILCFVVIRPVLKWVLENNTKDENYNEIHVNCILFGVVAFGFCTDALGAHAITGAYILGIILPKGELKDLLFEKVEDFVSGVMMPLFFLVVGLRFNYRHLTADINPYIVVLIILLTMTAKILSTLFISWQQQVPLTVTDSLSLAVLMNTKGILTLITLSSGRDLKVLDNQTYAVMLLACWLMTVEVSPILFILQKATWGSQKIQHRTIQNAKPDAEFRVLACIHNNHHVASIIHFLEFSNPTRLSPISVLAVELLKLQGRASAMLIMHDNGNKFNNNNSFNSSQGKANCKRNNITELNTLDNLINLRNEAIAVNKVTVMSPYSTMYEDICNIADEKRITLILIPFFKQIKDNDATGVGSIAAAAAANVSSSTQESDHHFIRAINQNVLDNAPCSIGIFVDRGLNTRTFKESSKEHMHKLRVAVLFVGGPDDREALAYAKRMFRRPNVHLMVIRFIPGPDAIDINPIEFPDADTDNIIAANKASEQERRTDASYVVQFKIEAVDCKNVHYVEKVVNNTEHLMEEIKKMEHDNYDLFALGRGDKSMSPLTYGLREWTDCPELGPLGDALVSSSITAKTSFLIVQQHNGIGDGAEDNDYKQGPGQLKEDNGHLTWHAPNQNTKTDDFEPFMHRRGTAARDYY